MLIGVYNIGQGCVLCLDYDEYYIFIFFNGYGRFIFIVFWVELGGECNINCFKIGYSVNIIFYIKFFYGGKKYRIIVEIFFLNDKKFFCLIEGEWNGVMYVKYVIGENIVFVDIKKLFIIKKKVRKLEDQNEYEFCSFWKDVIFNLKIRDIDVVIEVKYRFEER